MTGFRRCLSRTSREAGEGKLSKAAARDQLEKGFVWRGCWARERQWSWDPGEGNCRASCSVSTSMTLSVNSRPFREARLKTDWLLQSCGRNSQQRWEKSEKTEGVRVEFIHLIWVLNSYNDGIGTLSPVYLEIQGMMSPRVSYLS